RLIQCRPIIGRGLLYVRVRRALGLILAEWHARIARRIGLRGRHIGWRRRVITGGRAVISRRHAVAPRRRGRRIIAGWRRIAVSATIRDIVVSRWWSIGLRRPIGSRWDVARWRPGKTSGWRWWRHRASIIARNVGIW